MSWSFSQSKAPLGYIDDKGYLRVWHSDVQSRELKRDCAHRLIARWVSRIPLDKTTIVHHKDGDKLNNHVSNLSLVTSRDHAMIHRPWLHSSPTDRLFFATR